MSNLPDPRGSIFVSERPWGRFEQFTLNEPTTVKIVTVEPGHRLSLQTHEHRGEFWQVLDGPLDVTVGDDSWAAQTGDKVWVAPGTTHRMGNSGDASARVLEIGYGDFDEGDIVRLQDDYRR
ncbi:MAG: phosphomannose isomerase type II C-terminal cupin domain [Janibacter sp.]